MKILAKKQKVSLIVGILFVAIVSYNLCNGLLSNFSENHYKVEPCPQENQMEIEDCSQIIAKALVSVKSGVSNYKISSNVTLNELGEANLFKEFSNKFNQNTNYFSSYNSNLRSVIMVV